MNQYFPFRYFKTSPIIIRLAVMLYIHCPLSLRNVEDLLHKRGIEISHETVRYRWNLSQAPAIHHSWLAEATRQASTKLPLKSFALTVC